MRITLSGVYETKPFEFTYPPAGLIELFSIAGELEFDGVDYCATIPDLFSVPHNVFALSKAYDMPILGVHAPLHLLFYTPSFFFKRLLKMNQLFSDAQVFNFHLSGFITPVHRTDNNFQKFVTFVKKQNLPISIESNPRLVGLQHYPKVTYDPEPFAEYCIENNLPITFDTAHMAHWGVDIVVFFRKYHKYIKLIHLSDSIGSIQHLPLGKGNLPVKELLKEIKRKSYNELLTFEICNFPKNTTSKEKTEEIRKSFNMVKKYAL